MLQECYRNAIGILQEYCRNTAGILQAYVAGMLWECYWNAARILQHVTNMFYSAHFRSRSELWRNCPPDIGDNISKKNTKGRGALQGPGPIASLNSQIIRGAALARRGRLRYYVESTPDAILCTTMC